MGIKNCSSFSSIDRVVKLQFIADKWVSQNTRYLTNMVDLGIAEGQTDEAWESIGEQKLS